MSASPAKLCRCCLSEGGHKDLNSAYFWLNKKEVYSEMLQECFNIVLSTYPYTGTDICDVCISSLRDAYAFKKLIHNSELELTKMTLDLTQDEKPIKVKKEPEVCSDDSDDYFLADAISMDSVRKIKLEESPEPVKIKKKHSQKRSTATSSKKPQDKSWKRDQVKNLLTKIKKSNSDITIKKNSGSKQKLLSKHTKLILGIGQTVRAKHKEDLITILECSNVVPFRNKSLLGYSCGYCDKTFPDPQDLRTHTEDLHKKERASYQTNYDLTEYNVKVDITDLMCTLCDCKVDNLNALRQHLVSVHSRPAHSDIKDHIQQFKLKKGDVYDCAMCSATYETFKMLKQHMNNHYANYSCSVCDNSFATRRSLSAHRKTHQEGSFKCNQCEKIFSSESKKQYHVKTKHLGERSISNCPFCNEPFRSYYQRNQHLVKVHNSEAQYKCNVCNRPFILKSLLMYHIKKSHLMERNCQCTECGYRFFSKKALKAHMVKHTGERNYQCEVCQKSYARKYTLREHMRIHNNDRRFKCEVCAMSFVQKCSLKSHLLSNHGISMAASDISVQSQDILE